MAWLLRFKSWFIARYSQRSKNASVKMLLMDELQRAEGEIVKHVQIIALPCRGPSSIADDQFLKILPSSNYGAKELRPSCVNFTR